MTATWAVQLDLESAAALGPLRCMPGLEVLADDHCIWLAGADLSQLSGLEVLGLPAVERYQVQAGQLLPVGRRLPTGTLPDGPWRPLRDWLSVEVPRPLFAGQVDQGVALEVVRRAGTDASNLLITTMSACRSWAEHAPAVRLKALSIAVDARAGWAALRGRPTPPLPGRRYVVADRVGVASGWGFALPITHGEVAAQLGLSADTTALFEADGSWSAMPDDVFIAATRSTLRLLGGARLVDRGAR